jgi:hypothetical protein
MSSQDPEFSVTAATYFCVWGIEAGSVGAWRLVPNVQPAADAVQDALPTAHQRRAAPAAHATPLLGVLADVMSYKCGRESWCPLARVALSAALASTSDHWPLRLLS